MSDSNLPNGIVCTLEEYLQSRVSDQNPYPSITCLTRGQSIGVALTVESALISLLAVSFLFLLIIRNVFRSFVRDPTGNWRLLNGPMDIYMMSLFCSDLLQAIGYVLNIKWVHQGKVETGGFCTAQGIVQQLGETGVAMITLAIALHTFVGVMWRKGIHSRYVAFFVTGFIWTFTILFVSIGAGIHNKDNYEAPTPFWCWIGGKYTSERLWGEYFWIWLALFTSFLVYIPLYYWSKGNLSVDPEIWWRFRVHPRNAEGVEAGESKRAMLMLAYPLVYSVLVLPLSIVRWINFGLEKHGNDVPSVWSFLVITVFSLSGAMNVGLVLLTRPQLLLFGQQHATQTHHISSNGRSRGSRKQTKRMGRLNEDDDGGWNLPVMSRTSESSMSVS